MPLILEQLFPLGRFHATRWKQNPFEDRHGEWPPSPWRLLRALAARWFQYSREMGDEDEATRDEVLRAIALEMPAFYVPAYTWRGKPELRQYHRLGVDWTARGKKDAGYRKPMTSLVADHYRSVSPIEPVYWVWRRTDLSAKQHALLDTLVARVLYFGRAETLCRLRTIDKMPHGLEANCELDAAANDQAPVLVADPRLPLDIPSLLAATDDALLSNKPIPPGATWRYATLPRCPPAFARPLRVRASQTASFVQFAVGGRVFPSLAQWVRVTERFRGRVLRNLACALTGKRSARYIDLSGAQRQQISLVSGKDAHGAPLTGHEHAFFCLVPDESGFPTRLVCWRSEEKPFMAREVAALLAASEGELAWQPAANGWQLRLVPLPFKVGAPRDFTGRSRVWESLTPFVLPGNRRRFRRGGRERPSESPGASLRRLLLQNGFLEPNEICEVKPPTESEWVAIHETHTDRTTRLARRERAVRRGYRFRITFAEPVQGPMCLGHSCHFGMGLFLPSVE